MVIDGFGALAMLLLFFRSAIENRRGREANKAYILYAGYPNVGRALVLICTRPCGWKIGLWVVSTPMPISVLLGGLNIILYMYVGNVRFTVCI